MMPSEFARWRRASRPISAPRGRAGSVRKWAGRMRKASIRLMTSAAVMTMESWRVIWTSSPERKNQGMNATMVVKTANMTGLDTACAPEMAVPGPPLPAAWP